MNNELHHSFFRLSVIFKATNPFLNNAVIVLLKKLMKGLKMDLTVFRLTGITAKLPVR